MPALMLTDSCPVDNTKLTIVVENLAVAEQISEIFVYCKYGCALVDGVWVRDEHGCQQTVRISARRSEAASVMNPHWCTLGQWV